MSAPSVEQSVTSPDCVTAFWFVISYHKPMMLLFTVLACTSHEEPPTTYQTTSTADGFEMSKLKTEVNPNNALSFWVTWATSQPATGEVSFGADGVYTYTVGHTDLTSNHRVLVYGIPEKTEVSFVALSENAQGDVVSLTSTNTTGALPEEIPTAELGVSLPDRQPGWTLINTSNRTALWPGAAVIYDELARPVWYHITSPDEVDVRGDVDVSLTKDLTVILGGSRTQIHPIEVNLAGEVVWRGPRNDDGHAQHHHFRRNDDGTTTLLRYANSRDQWAETTVDRIQIINDDLEILWDWDGYDHFDLPEGELSDWCHANSVTVTDEAVYLNCRNQSTLYKIDKNTKEILWELGAGRDFSPDPNHPRPWFSLEHEPERQEDGSWLIYDNNGIINHTRVLHMAVNEQTMSTEILWEFPGDFDVDPWYKEQWASTIWGDADRLENGNVLICAATRDLGKQSRVFEVNLQGEVVWEMLLPSDFDTEWMVGTYRAQRVAPPGLAPYSPRP